MQRTPSKQSWMPLKMLMSLHWTTTAATSAALARHACALQHLAERLPAKRTGLSELSIAEIMQYTACRHDLLHSYGEVRSWVLML